MDDRLVRWFHALKEKAVFFLAAVKIFRKRFHLQSTLVCVPACRHHFHRIRFSNMDRPTCLVPRNIVEATKQREKALSNYNQLLDEATSSILFVVIDLTMGEIDFCPPYEFIISRTRPWLEAEEDLPQIAIVVTYSIHDSTKVSPRRCSCTTLLPARAAIMHPGTGVRIIRLRPSR